MGHCASHSCALLTESTHRSPIACNWWVAGSNPCSVSLGQQDTSPDLPADGGQWAGWRLCMAASLLSVCHRTVVATLCIYNIYIVLLDTLLFIFKKDFKAYPSIGCYK
ncbi:hypothetical protein ILYODFUR_026790 [Ilyodon furcidens]|uniref:Uncharacterized protein n=1 Tax=Ilyodon furcidens TaxID=33524 RepID=A0ABV0SR86_9TELE